MPSYKVLWGFCSPPRPHCIDASRSKQGQANRVLMAFLADLLKDARQSGSCRMDSLHPSLFLELGVSDWGEEFLKIIGILEPES